MSSLPSISMSMGQAISHYNLPGEVYYASMGGHDVSINEIVANSDTPITTQILTRVFMSVGQMQTARKNFQASSVDQKETAKEVYRVAFAAMKETFNQTRVSDSFYNEIFTIEELDAKQEKLDKVSAAMLAQAEKEQKEYEENDPWNDL